MADQACSPLSNQACPASDVHASSGPNKTVPRRKPWLARVCAEIMLCLTALPAAGNSIFFGESFEKGTHPQLVSALVLIAQCCTERSHGKAPPRLDHVQEATRHRCAHFCVRLSPAVAQALWLRIVKRLTDTRGARCAAIGRLCEKCESSSVC